MHDYDDNFVVNNNFVLYLILSFPKKVMRFNYFAVRYENIARIGYNFVDIDLLAQSVYKAATNLTVLSLEFHSHIEYMT